MNVFVDTSVWSLLLRRDRPPDVPQVQALVRALEAGERILTTGLVLQELLQGFSGPKARNQIVEHFAQLPLIIPSRADHVAAAQLRNQCRKRGVQVGTIDALLAQICIGHKLTMLTCDEDFTHIAKIVSLKLWKL